MYKQLTKEDRLRIYIYEGLNRNESLSEIGRAIGKDRSTIAREIKRNREAKAGSYYGKRNMHHEEGRMFRAWCMRRHVPQDQLLEMR